MLTVTVRTAEPPEGVGFEDEGVGQVQPHSDDWLDDTFFVKSISMPRHAFHLLMICKVLIENQEKNYVVLCFVHELGGGLCFPVSGLQQVMSRRCNWE